MWGAGMGNKSSAVTAGGLSRCHVGQVITRATRQWSSLSLQLLQRRLIKCNDTLAQSNVGERNEERDEIRRVASRRKEASACMHACGAATTAPLPPIRSSLLPKHKNH